MSLLEFLFLVFLLCMFVPTTLATDDQERHVLLVHIDTHDFDSALSGKKRS